MAQRLPCKHRLYIGGIVCQLPRQLVQRGQYRQAKCHGVQVQRWLYRPRRGNMHGMRCWEVQAFDGIRNLHKLPRLLVLACGPAQCHGVQVQRWLYRPRRGNMHGMRGRQVQAFDGIRNLHKLPRGSILACRERPPNRLHVQRRLLRAAWRPLYCLRRWQVPSLERCQLVRVQLPALRPWQIRTSGSRSLP
jgi:hypothetical protein